MKYSTTDQENVIFKYRWLLNRDSALTVLTVFHYLMYSSLLLVYYLINTTILTFYDLVVNTEDVILICSCLHNGFKVYLLLM